MHSDINLTITPDTKLSGIIFSNPYAMLCVEHLNICMPLHEKTIREVCEEKKISLSVFLTFLNLYSGSKYVPKEPFEFDDIHVIVDYLKSSHNYYLGEIYPRILSTIREMNEINTHKEVALVEKFFETYISEVREHLDYEDSIVFPYILELLDQKAQYNGPMSVSQYSVEEYREHHDDIEEKLDDLKNLIIKYLPGSNDSIQRRKLLLSLYELDYDLKIHSQIEDLILIPLVAKMEAYLNKVK